MATRDGVASAAQREVRGWSTGDDGFELFEGAVEGFGGVSDAHDTEMMNLNLGVGMNVNIKHTTSAKSSSRDGASPSTDKGKGSRGGSDGSKRGGGSGRGKDGDAAARAQSPVSAEAQRLRIEREKEGMSRIGNNKSMQRERWRFHHRVAAVLKDIWQSLQKLGRGQRDMSKSHYIQMHLAVQQEVNEHVVDPHEMSGIADEDWNKASQGFASLDFDRFSIAWYKLAERWGGTVSLDEYVAFSERVFYACIHQMEAKGTKLQTPSPGRARSGRGFAERLSMSPSKSPGDKVEVGVALPAIDIPEGGTVGATTEGGSPVLSMHTELDVDRMVKGERGRSAAGRRGVSRGANGDGRGGDREGEPELLKGNTMAERERMRMLKRAQEQKRLGSGDIRWLPAHVRLRKDVSARLGRNVDLGEGQLMNIKRAGGHDRALVLAKPTFDRAGPTELSLDVGGDIDGGAGLGSGAGAVVSETPGAADPVTALLNVQPADSPSIAEGLGMGSPSVGGLGPIVDRNGLTNQAQLSQLADQGPGAEVETRPRLRSVSIDELEPSGSFESESLKQAKAVWSNKANHHISRMKLRKAPLRALNDFGDEAGPSSRASRMRAASQAKRRGAGGGRSARPDEAGGAARARRAEVESRPRQQQLEEQHMLQQQQQMREQQMREHYRQDYAYPYQQYQEQLPPQSITDAGPPPYSPTSSYSYTYDEAQPYGMPRTRAHSDPAQQPRPGADPMVSVQHHIPTSYEDEQGPASPVPQPPSPTVYSGSGVGPQLSQTLDPVERALTPTTPQMMSEAASQVASEEADGALPDLRNMFIPCAWPGCPLEACLWSTEEKKAYCVGCWPRMPFHADIGLAVSADVLQRSGMVSQGQAQAEQGGSFVDTSQPASQFNEPASWGASGSLLSGSAGYAQDHHFSRGNGNGGGAGEYADDLDSTDLAYAGYGDAFVYDVRNDPPNHEHATDHNYDESLLSGYSELGPGRRYFEAVRRGVAGLSSAHRSRGLLGSRGHSSASEAREPPQPSAASRLAATRRNDEEYRAYLAQYDEGGGERGTGAGGGAGADPMQTVASAGAVRLVEHPATVARRIKDQRAARKRRYTIAKAKANERAKIQAMAEEAERKRMEEEKARAELEAQKAAAGEAAGEEAKGEGGEKGVAIGEPEKGKDGAAGGTSGSLSISTDVTGFENVKQVRRPQSNNKPMKNYTRELVPDVPDLNFKVSQKQENFQKIGSTVVVMRPGVVVGAPTGFGEHEVR